MILSSLRRHWPLIWFVGILLAGFVLTTIFYAASHTINPGMVPDEKLTERYKEIIDTQSALTKWLMGIASGSIAALVGIRLKGGASEDLFDGVPMAAYAFLLTSLYGGFLNYQATLNILRRGPLSYFYADQMRLPGLIQFWSLIAGLILLAVWLFRRKPIALLPSLLLLVICYPASGQTGTFDINRCVDQWNQDRKLGPDFDRTGAVEVLKRISALKSPRPLNSCEDVYIVLDHLRFESTLAGNQDVSTSFNSFLKSLVEEMNHPDLGTSNVVQAVVKLMAIWEKAFGVITIRSTQGSCVVLIDGAEVGRTNWTGRLEPGKHRVVVVFKGKRLYSNDALEILDGQSAVIDAEGMGT